MNTEDSLTKQAIVCEELIVHYEIVLQNILCEEATNSGTLEDSSMSTEEPGKIKSWSTTAKERITKFFQGSKEVVNRTLKNYQ